MEDLPVEQNKYAANLDIYKTLLDICEKQIDRRLLINRYYVSIIAAITAAAALIATRSQDTPTIIFILKFSSLCIFFITISWLSHVMRSRFQNASRFATLRVMENDLPAKPLVESDATLKASGLHRLARALDNISDYILPLFIFILSLATTISPPSALLAFFVNFTME